MLVSTSLSTLVFGLSALITLPANTLAFKRSNFTLRSDLESRVVSSGPGGSGGSGGSGASKAKQSLTCANVQGNFNGYAFNFGCLCETDVSSFCGNAGVDSYVEQLLNNYIAQYGTTNSYPANAQPTCDGKGGYTCGSLTRQSDGSCGSSGCQPSQCSSNGGCCPRGQTYAYGRCCGSTGCSHSQQSCGPSYQCNGYESNGMCCHQGSGYHGCNTVCCPNGQTEQGNSGTCMCPQGQMKNPSNPNQCITSCPSGWSYCSSQCCPQYATEQGGSCVCDSQHKMTGTGNSRQCIPKCQPNYSFCQTQCCKTYMSESNGQCVCPTGYKDSGSACVPICDSQHTYNPKTGNCDPKCDTAAGYTYQQGWWGQGMCCMKGQTACSTVCCPVGKEEIKNPDGSWSGKCCAQGCSVKNNNCMCPTGGGTHRRNLADQLKLANSIVNALNPFSHGMEENRDGKMCPTGLAACPITGASGYECLDSSSDIQSCGGCASLDQGADCTTIPGAKWMGCSSGKCEVYSCIKGWKMVNGTTCERK